MFISQLNHYHEKMLFGVSTLLSASCAFLGAMLSVGEVRWLLVTLTTSILTSSFLALTFKKPAEAIGLVVGRCGIAILGGVCATKLLVHYFKVNGADSDVIVLGGLSGASCLVTYTVGWALIKVMETKAPELANKIFKIGANKIIDDKDSKS